MELIDIDRVREIIKDINKTCELSDDVSHTQTIVAFKNINNLPYKYNDVIVKRNILDRNVYLKDVLKIYGDYTFVILPKFRCERSHTYEYKSSSYIINCHYEIGIYDDWIKTEFGAKYLKHYGKAGFYKVASNVLHVPLSTAHALIIYDNVTTNYHKEKYINE